MQGLYGLRVPAQRTFCAGHMGWLLSAGAIGSWNDVPVQGSPSQHPYEYL